MSNYLTFILREKKEKTNVWSIQHTDNKAMLGEIRWHPPWRQYVFVPDNFWLPVFFSAGCLREIADFIMEQMRARNKGR